MDCPNCGTKIPANERYCRNCGYDALALDKTLRAPAPTQPYVPANLTGAPSVDPNAKTEYLNVSAPPTAEIPRALSTASNARRSPLIIPLTVIGVLLVVGIAATLAYFFWPGRNSSADSGNALPDHFGIFIQGGEQLKELRRRDFSNALEGRDNLASDAALPEAVAQPVFILYAEPQDISVSDLKLVELSSINQNGQVRYWSFQVAPVEGRRGMKQIRVAGGLPSGKYAFALLNGYLNEGNHKLWPFEVKEGVAEPQEQPQAATIPVKANPSATPQTGQAQPTPKPTPNNEPPPGAKLGYCNDTNVFVRNSPDLNAKPVTKITKGQKLWAIGKSTNTSTWNGVTSDWTQVQLYNSATRGWVFSPFVSY
jgi:hypothetical protein